MFTNIALWDGDIVTYMIRCDIVILLDIVLGVLVVLQEWCVAVSAAYHESSHQRQVTPSPSWGYQYKGFGTIYSPTYMLYVQPSKHGIM